MAVIALLTAGKVHPVIAIGEGYEAHHFVAEEAITQGQAFRLTTAGLATKANSTAAGEAGPALFIAIDGARQAGDPVLGMAGGLLEGFNLDARSIGDVVYLNDTDGSIGDAAGTVSTVVGRVHPVPISGTPSTVDKLLKLNLPK